MNNAVTREPAAPAPARGVRHERALHHPVVGAPVRAEHANAAREERRPVQDAHVAAEALRPGGADLRGGARAGGVSSSTYK